ncbi:MAG: universal stress protein [Caulobacteraceae bacterium]
MDIKDIIVFSEAGRASAAASLLAARVARDQDAYLVGMCHISEPIPPAGASYAVGAAVVDWVLDGREQAIDEAVEVAAESFHLAVAAMGCASAWRVSEKGAPLEAIARLATGFDMAVVPRHDPADARLAERVLLSGGTPCLIVPYNAPQSRPIERILVAWDASRAARQALADAIPLLKKAKQVRLVVVGHEALADDGEDPCGPIVHHLARHGIIAELRHIPDPAADVGSTLLDHSVVFDADLVVMGAYGRGRLAESICGGATRTFLTRGTTPVLMSH